MQHRFCHLKLGSENVADVDVCCTSGILKDGGFLKLQVNKLYPRTKTIHIGAIKRIVYSIDIFINSYVK